MKKLVTASEINELIAKGQKTIYLEPGTIVTPSAKDVACERKVAIVFGPAAAAPVCCPAGEGEAADLAGSIEPGLIERIVKEVMASLPQLQLPQQVVKEADTSGIRLVRGDSVKKCEPFDTGNPKDKVGITEILTRKESPNLATGFMTMENGSAFEWTLGYEELDYIIEGTLDIIINGKTYRGKAGDVFYIPKNTHITFSTPDHVKFFFVTYPANWAELSN